MNLNKYDFENSNGLIIARNRLPTILSKLQFFGPIYTELWRKGVCILKDYSHNGVVNVGKNSILDTMFNSATQVTSTAWCMGLINSAGFSSLPNSDTMASHGTWVEFTGYSQTTRVAWGQGAASGQLVTNATACTFDVTSAATLQGLFIVSNNTKGGTSGLLWTTGLFSQPIPVAIADQCKIQYGVAC